MWRTRAAAFDMAVGAALGAALFLLEAALMARSGAIGFSADLQGPFAEVVRAVRPHLPSLLGRVLAVYLVAGAALGAGAGALTWLLCSRTRAGRALGFAVNLLGLWLLCAAYAGIRRPALFDDVLPSFALRWVADVAEPSWVGVIALGWAVGHCAVFLGRGGRQALRQGVPRPSSLGIAAALVVAAVVAVVASSHGAARPKGPLTVLIGIDAFRPDRLTAQGSARPVAPHLERLVKDATLFTNAWTPIAQTEPAYRSLLTARWPLRTGVRYPLTAESRQAPAQTFAGRLTAAGRHTVWATDCSRFNFQTRASGFAERLQPPRGAINFALEKLRFRGVGIFAANAAGAAWLPELVDNRALAGIHDPLAYAHRLARKLVSLPDNALFAFHATAAHFPGDPVHPYHRRFVRDDAPLARRLRMFFAPITAEQGAPPVADWTRADAEALYDELLAQADAQAGILLEALRRAGRYDEATIVVFSDHGESFHEDHPELAAATPVHGARLGEEENRILLAVKLPASRRRPVTPARVDGLVRLVDLGPTILELQGAPPLWGDGVSLLPALLHGEGRLPRLRLYAETGFTHASPSVFEPLHLARARRTFDIYRLRPDGVAEIGAETHEQILAEKDVGAFDGERWVRRLPMADGRTEERCEGNCPAPALSAWLDALAGQRVARQP